MIKHGTAALKALDMKPEELWVSCAWEVLCWGAGLDQQEWSSLHGCKHHWVPLAKHMDAQV